MPVIDQPTTIRPGEELPIKELGSYMSKQIGSFGAIRSVAQFPGGYSNLTYLLYTGQGEYVLRRPPIRARIKSAHDMSREFRMLCSLKGHYSRIPNPIHYCDDEAIIGSPFYLMSRVKGLILRDKIPQGVKLPPAKMKRISEIAVDGLVEIHQLDLKSTGLETMGKPDGYVARQVDGWTARYHSARTEEIKSMSICLEWLQSNLPDQNLPALVHNDYKFDNLILDAETQSTIMAVLDWEMSTVGDPLMDLGSSLAYWKEQSDTDEHLFPSLTQLPGSLNREEMVARYFSQIGKPPVDTLFYFVFGCFKLGVIIQQIYARYKKGFTKDPRFASLIDRVKACGTMGANAISLNRISRLYEQ